jgi:hypothetical protein
MFVLCVVSKDQERQNAGQSRQKQVPTKYRVQENTKKIVVGIILSAPSRPDLGPTQPPVQWVLGVFPGG